jgi:hypothetical protein
MVMQGDKNEVLYKPLYSFLLLGFERDKIFLYPADILGQLKGLIVVSRFKILEGLIAFVLCFDSH